MQKKGNPMENQDRISGLPDDIILRKLSFLSIKHAIHTCILSSRWINLWKFLPTLTFVCSQFTTVEIFTEFVSRILSLRNNSTELHTLIVRSHKALESCLLETILKYAVSNNVQLIDIGVTCDMQHFPTCLLSCRTLTSLDLYVCHPTVYGKTRLFPTSLNMPLLASLSVRHFAFSVGNDGRVDPFSALTNLKSLRIVYCEVVDQQKLCISSTKLVSLVIYMVHYAPKTYFGIELSAPNLSTFAFSGIPVQKLCWSKSNLSSIKKARIDIIEFWKSEKTSLVLLDWLFELASMELLVISSTALQVLSLVPNLLVEFPWLCNLKSLTVEKKHISSIPDGIVDILIQNSPSPKVYIID